MLTNYISITIKQVRISILLTLSYFCLNHSVIAGQAIGLLHQSSNTTDRIIIKYKNSSNMNATGASALAFMRRNLMSKPGLNIRHVRQMHSGAHIMQLDKHTPVNEVNVLLSSIQADPEVEYAEPDLLLKPLAIPNDSRYNEQWHYFEATAGINLPAAWDITQGASAVVAVLDTGIRPHIDLAANLLPGYDMISDLNIAQDGNARDADASDPGDWAPAGACGAGSSASNSSWHGTHVAGTVGAVGNNSMGVAGVAYAAQILPVRVLGRCGGYTSDIADGIIWAAGGSVSGVPVNNQPADVINLSLGGAGSCGITQQNAINTARSLGSTVVVAAGNENINASNSNPANCTGVIAVAAVNRAGSKASYSNFGSVVDVAAPGGQTNITANGILSTLNTGSTGPASDSYAFYQGTSMATPHVAGVAALLYSVSPGITPDEVELTLKSTSRAFPGTCSQCGSGIIDAAAAVLSTGATAPAPAPVPVTDNVLINGVTKTPLQGSTGSTLTFTIDVPTDATNLSFSLSDGTGDADLYVKYATQPTTSSYDCRPYLSGNNETCNISLIQAGTYYVMIRGYSSYSNTSLIASFTEPSSASGWTESGLSALTGQWQHFTLDVPAGMGSLNAEMSAGQGDADLYVRFNAASTTSSYLCRPYRTGNNESCTFTNPQAGRWYISVRAYSSYSGVNLQAGYLP